MQRNFALYDSDIFYATRFMEYFKREKEFDFEISVFTHKESLDEFLQLHSVEILLLGDQILFNEDNVSDKIKYIYQLTDHIQIEKEIKYPVVFKYQSVRKVMNEILDDYAGKENEAQHLYNSEHMNIISIFPLVHKVQSLLYTWSVSSLLAERNKALLIMLELLPIQVISSVNYTNYSLTEFIYYLRENSDIIAKMKTLLKYHGNLAYLTGAAHGADILSLSKEDIQKWVEELRIHAGYQTIVFYAGCYSDSMIELMNLSNLVFTLRMDTSYEELLYREWITQMERSGINIRQDKFRSIQLQEENDIWTIPITIPELVNTSFWEHAKNNLNNLILQ